MSFLSPVALRSHFVLTEFKFEFREVRIWLGDWSVICDMSVIDKALIVRSEFTSVDVTWFPGSTKDE